MHGSIVLLGKVSLDTAALSELVLEFGWTLDAAAGLDQLRDLAAGKNLVAILFDANGLGLPCQDALRSVRDIAPHALAIPCHRFSDIVNWPDWAEAGAFHAIALPWSPSEVRQSLGFVWAARLRRSANVLSISAAERRTADKSPSTDIRARAAESVA